MNLFYYLLKTNKALFCLILFNAFCFFAPAQTFISGIINNYTSVVNLVGQTATVSASAGFSPGDKVMIIQMKGVGINTANTINYGTITAYNDAGNYELATLNSVAGTVFTFANPLIKTYATTGIVQLVKVPVYSGNVVVSALLTCQPWNGATGGVLCFEATGNITLNANIDVSGRGFMGGNPQPGSYSCLGDSTNYVIAAPSLFHGEKGEGVFINSAAQRLGKGKNANGGGGGNDLNGGAAGGGNYGAGGHGGNIQSNASCPPNFIMLSGGIGGQAMPYSNAINKIYLGGGGGAGQQNDNQSPQGANGGALVLIRTCVGIIGNNNFIRSDGIDQVVCGCIDGQSGGGAGGTVLIDAPTTTALNISVKGGVGGSDTYAGTACHGKGGGGGGGIIWTLNGFTGITPTLNGGAAGLFLSPTSGCFNTSLGATAGATGGTLTGLSVPGAGSLTGTLSVLGSTTICPTQSATLTASGGVNYTWTPANVNSGTISVSPAATTVYSVVASTTSGCNYTGSATITVANAVNISIAASPTLICSGQIATLTASGAASYTWLPSNQQSPVITVTPSTSQTYTLLSSQNSCTAMAVQTISVIPTPTISIPVTNTIICFGQSFNILASGAGSYTWLPNNTTGANFSASPTSNTTYTVASNNNGCLSNTTFTVVVQNPLTLLLNGACVGETATLTAGGMQSYTWQPMNVFAPTITVSPIATSVYTVTGDNGSGCVITKTIAVTLQQIPTITIASVGINSIICIGNPYQLNASGANTYTWLPGNVSTNPVIFYPTVNSTYTVIGDVNGCKNAATISVAVVDAPQLSVSAPDLICKGDNATIFINGASQYTCITSNGTFYSNTINFSPNATNTVIIIGQTGNCIDSISFVINVSNVTAGFAVNGDYDFDLPIEFINTSVNNFHNEWHFGNGQTSYNSDPVIIYNDPGDYLVQLIVTDTNGCKDGINKKITIGCNNMQLYVPNSFTPNSDGLNDIFKIVGISQCMKDFKCEIFNRWGEKIKEIVNLSDVWDGTFKGEIVEDDVYVYKISFVDLKSKNNFKTGHVLVIKGN